MKTNRFLALAAVATMLAACSNENIPVEETKDIPITIEAGFGLSGRVATDGLASTFESGDAISVYAWTGGTTMPTDASAFQVNNVKNTFDGTNWTATPQMLWKDNATPHYFLGVYPQTDIFTTTTYTLDPTKQEQSDLLVATNFGANNEGIVQQSNPVSLAFGHVMAKLRVNIKFNDEFTASTVVSGVTAEAKTTADIDWQTATATATGTATGVELPALAAASGYAYSYESVMVPQTGFKSVAMVIDGQIYTFVSSADIELKKGTVTTLNLTVGRNSIEAGDMTIIDWTLEGEIDGYLKNIDTEIAALQAELTELKTSVATDQELAAAVAALEEALKQAKSELTTASEEAKSAIGSELEGIKTRLGIVEADINSINQQIDAINGSINELKNSFANRIQSLTFVPQYSDGKILMDYTSNTTQAHFRISPAEIAKLITADNVKAFARYTNDPTTRAFYEPEFPLTVTSVMSDETGMLEVNIAESGENKLSTDFWQGKVEAIIYIQITDENGNNVVSEAIPMIAHNYAGNTNSIGGFGDGGSQNGNAGQ